MLAESVAVPPPPAAAASHSSFNASAQGAPNEGAAGAGLHSALSSLSLLSLPEYTQFPNISLPELPSYTPGDARRSRRREQCEHAYHLLDGAGRPWLTLRVKSWALSEKHQPLFIEGGTINGLVEMNLEKTDNVKQVVVYVSVYVDTVAKIEIFC